MKSITRIIPQAAFFGLATLLGVASTQAASIFTDTFTGISSLNADGWYFYSGGAAWSLAQASWYPTYASPITGNIMRNPSGSAANTIAVKQFSTVSLSLGDYIEFKLDFVSANTGTLNVSLLKSANTMTANAISSGITTSDGVGYGFAQAMRTTAQTAAYSETGVTSHSITNSSITGEGSTHSLTFRLTEVATGVEISSWMDGVAYASYIDTTTPYTSFNTVSLVFNNGGSAAVAVDNLSLSYVAVPEPSTAFLCFAGMGALAVYANKRRKLAQ